MLEYQEIRLKKYLHILSVIYCLAIIGYLLPGIISLPEILKPVIFINDPAFVNNSTVKIGLFFLLCFIAAFNIRKNRVLIIIAISAMALAEVTSILLVLFAKNNYVMIINGNAVTIKQLLIVSIVFDGLLGVLLLILFISAEKSRYKLFYLSPMQFRTLKSIAEVVLNGTNELVIKPSEVAINVDFYLKEFTAKSKWISKVVLIGMQLYPLLSFKVPLSYLDKSARLDFLKKRFYQDVQLRILPDFIIVLIQAMIRMSKQLCYMGYYNDPRTFESVGYLNFKNRNDYTSKLQKYPILPPKRLLSKSATDIVGDIVKCDVLIIGSGAAASVLAKGLVEKGRQVLMIERGKHVYRDELNENEISMVSKLYADGALQLASDFRLQVFQGSCVGGSTVVNNAVCFDLPEEVVQKWNDENELNAGIDEKRYFESQVKVKNFMGVNNVPEMAESEFLNPSGKLFIQGIKNMNLNKPPHYFGSVSANTLNCIGCGYCNIGCAYGKKLSMLETVLPNIQEKYGNESLEILSECEALKFRSTGKKIDYVLCRFSSGKLIKIKANTFILSAGAISSSIVLQQSSISKNSGKRLSFNLGSQITAAFEHPVNSFDGLQISHYLNISPSQGYIVETWYNPPMFQSTAMPGWFEDHFNNMKRYNKLACAGILVGTEANAEVRSSGLTGRIIHYKPTQSDLKKLLDGLELSGRIFLNAGAKSIIPNTFRYYEFNNEEELQKLKYYVKGPRDISLGSGHPQGGNIISKNSEIGVVDSDFKVFGYDNLYVCDASVFPSSIGVNPQITVMSLADYAVDLIQ